MMICIALWAISVILFAVVLIGTGIVKPCKPLVLSILLNNILTPDGGRVLVKGTTGEGR